MIGSKVNLISGEPYTQEHRVNKHAYKENNSFKPKDLWDSNEYVFNVDL